MSLRAETSLEVKMTIAITASATVMETETTDTATFHRKTMNQATSQESVIVASGLRLNLLVTKKKNSLSV